MAEPALWLITGVMAAGKSTVGQALAERFPRGVHLRGDSFRRAVVSGRAEMTEDPSDEALAQLRLRYRLAAMAGDAYVEAGFTTVVQDIIVGEILGEALAMFRTRPLALVVLAPTVEEVARREHDREKMGYKGFTPGALDAAFRAETPRLGLWIDTTSMTPDETVDMILERADPEALIG